jgi:hypothetical protein
MQPLLISSAYPLYFSSGWLNKIISSWAKLGNRSDEAMKRCDEALNASSLQFLCQR